MATRGIWARRFTVLCLAFLMFAAPVMAQDAGSLLKQGLEQLRAGKYTEAIATLRKALAADPSNEDVMAALGRAEYDALLALIASGKEGTNIAKALLDLAMPVLPDKAFNKKELAELIQRAVTLDDATDRFEAQMTLARVYGEFAVPGLVNYLSSSNTDHKIAAHIAISRRIGRDAVLPLTVALASKDAGVRRIICTELGIIGDERAIPALTSVAAKDGDATVQKEANAALAKLTKKYDYAQGMSASELYGRLATRYYGGDYTVLTYSDRPLVLWNWSGDALASAGVPRHLYVLKLAEGACYNALRADPSNASAASLLARVIASEKLSSDAAAKVSDDDLTKQYAAGLRDAAGLVAALGSSVLTQAIGDAIDDDDQASAAFLLKVLPWVNASGEMNADNPVVRATEDGAANVRFMAAEAILRFNGVRRITAFPDPAGFMGRVAQAAGETIPRQVLVADANDGRRNKILRALNEAGYTAYDARSGSSGVVRALRFAGIDLIILSSDLGDMEPLAAITKLRAEDRTKNVPIVVVGTSAEAANEEWRNLYAGKAANVAGIPDGPGLPTEEFNKIIAGSFGGENPSQKAAFTRASSVLDAIATTDTNNTLFPWNTLTNTLTQLLTANVPNDPPVRLNAIRALGNVGDPAAVGALAAFFGSTDDDNLRAAAGMAIAHIALEEDVALDDAAFGALLKGTKSGNANVRTAAFAALGATKLMPAQSLKVVNTNRPGASAGGGDGCGCGDGCGDGCGCGCGCG